MSLFKIAFINLMVFLLTGLLSIFALSIFGLNITDNTSLWVWVVVYLVAILAGMGRDYYSGRYFGIALVGDLFDKIIGYCLSGLAWVFLLAYVSVI